MRRPPALLPFLVWLAQTLSPSAAEPIFHGQAEHIVLVIWDGMRPDFITPETTPTLHALAQSGTFFAQHHSVYITSTEVNGAAIATGCFPGRNGILANREYRPEVDPSKPFSTESSAAARKMDALRDGQYLRVPTLAERVRAAGWTTAVAGTKPVALLHDRAPQRAAGSAVLFAGNSYPPELAKKLAGQFGQFPSYPTPELPASNTAQNAWTTRALTEEMWKDGVPAFSTLWLGDPDFSQHLTQPGAPIALQGIRDSDNHLAQVLAALEARGVREKTDVFVVSDHGFSTVERAVEIGAAFRAAGCQVVSEFSRPPAPGEVLMIGLGGSLQFYVPQHDPALIQRLVDFLQTSAFCGPIFTRETLPGTFALRQAFLESPDSADIVCALRWSTGKNRSGVAGGIVAEGRRTGYGTHASLSPFDVHNTLVAAGPDFRSGFIDPLPTANIDLAPTILKILGIAVATPLDGRVLAEALSGLTPPSSSPSTATLEASTPRGERFWRQYLRITTLDGHAYLDEGNASLGD